MRKDKKNQAVIKAISGFMLIFMLCLGSGGVKASAEGGGDEPSPVPTPTPTVSAQEITPAPGEEVIPDDAAPTDADEEESDTAETPTPTIAEEDGDEEEPGIDLASTPTPTPFPIQEAVITLAFDTAVYTGENITQKVVSVVWGFDTLVENKDYIIGEGLIRREIGNYKVSIIGINAYKGTAYAEWSIVAPTPTPEPTETPTPAPDDPDPSDVTPTPTEGPTPIPEPGLRVLGVQGKLYTGSKITQDDVIVKYDGLLLAKGRDYSIKYKNNVDAGVAKMIVTGKGNYKGKCIVDFTIYKIDLNEYCTAEDLVVSVKSPVNDKTPEVRWGDTVLKRLRDYNMSIEPKNLKEPGVYDIEISGTGNFTGSINISATVMDGVNVKNLRVSKIPEQTWTGFAITPRVNITYRGKEVTSGIEITYEDNIETGKGYLVITGNGEPFNGDTVFAGRVKVPFKIKGKDLADVAIISVKNAVYTGKPCTPEIKVKVGSHVLSEGTDYTTRFKYNRKVGTAYYHIYGCGRYSGKVRGEFEITQCSINDLDVDISIPERVYYEKDGPMPVPVITHNNILLRENIDYTLTYSENRNAGKLFKVTIEGIGNYYGRATREVMCYAKPIDMTISMTPDPAWKKFTRVKKYIVKPVLMDSNGLMLEEGIDYEADYTYTDIFGQPLDYDEYMPQSRTICIHIEARGNYSGETVIEYRAAASKISKAKFKVDPQIYTGYPIEPGQEQITASVETGQYEIIYYKNNVKTGTASMIVHGLGEYGGYKKVKFKITKYAMNE